VSVFGRGVGECIVVHLGTGDWAIVDSFRPFGPRDDPIALKYLHSLGVDAEASVKLIVATHWDDDHHKGLSKLVADCPNARVVWSAALEKRRFFDWAERHQQRTRSGPYSSGVREFCRVSDLLDQRGTRPVWASDMHRIYAGATSEVWCVAPSHATVGDDLAAVLGEAITAEPGDSVRAPEPNATSVVLWLKSAEHCVLLGGDLESTPNDDLRGWGAVLNSDVVVGHRADAFKIPHHGSDDADDDRVWQVLVADGASSAVTPYARLKDPLPRPEDCTRILARQTDCRVAGRAAGRTRPEPLVRRFVNSATRDGLRAISGPVGHVRMRVVHTDASDTWSVDMFGEARELEDHYRALVR
jgi:hypothetical protein